MGVLRLMTPPCPVLLPHLQVRAGLPEGLEGWGRVSEEGPVGSRLRAAYLLGEKGWPGLLVAAETLAPSESHPSPIHSWQD